MLRSDLFRTIGVLFSAALIGPLSAQEFHHYRATVAGMTSTMQEKEMTDQLQAADLQGKVYVDRSTGAIDWTTTLRMERIQFAYRVGRYGLSVETFEEIGTPQPPLVRTPRRPQLADMPLYMDTGDPQRDNERYDAYKAAWIATHPDQYEELTAPSSVAGTGTNE